VIKGFSFFFLCAVTIYANTLEQKIESFLGKNEYHVQKNLIDIIFQDRQSYYLDADKTDDLKIVSKLKENGLLKLFYDSPIEMKLSFQSQGSSLVFMRVINESLEAMGYSYFLTDSVVKSSEGFSWVLKLSTEHVVDPILLANEMRLRGCEIVEIQKRDSDAWSYKIDTHNINVKATKYETNTTVKLKKPIKAYWIDIEEAKSISLRSKLADRWHPSVVFYDNNLNVISFYEKDEVVNFVKIDIPKSVKYVKIGDIYTLDNIKRGLSLYLVSK
jgi:hypothetical protein